MTRIDLNRLGWASGPQIDAIAFHARLTPDRLAARDLIAGLEWSYHELDILVGRLAARLLERQCRMGDRIALVARNSVSQVALHFACARIGAIFVPLNWRLSRSELSGLLERIRPRLLLGDGVVRSLPGSEPLVDFVISALTCRLAQTGPIDPARTSLILFTSGASGFPKGVMLSEANLWESAINFASLASVDSRSSFLCEAPMFHIIGLVANVRPVLVAGGSIQVTDGFQPQRTLGFLSDPHLGISHCVGVPRMMAVLRDQADFDPVPLRRLTALVSGGAPHPEDDMLAWLAYGVPMVAGFGMSEAGTIFGMPVDLDVIRRKLGSVGIAAPGIQVRIVDVAGAECPVGVPGELQLRGPGVTQGYWQDPKLTRKAIDGDGWFATGDIVRVDEDGFYWIVDRKKDMFISGGENIYPAEIEKFLVGYPGVAECAVIGLADAIWGEIGCLVVVASDVGVDEEQLLTYLASCLARFKLPRRVVFVDSFPRTATGKLQKARLKEMVAAANSDPN